MKQYLNEIIYITLLGTTFAFFVCMGNQPATIPVKQKAVLQVECSNDATKESLLEDYTYSPLRYVNGYN